MKANHGHHDVVTPVPGLTDQIAVADPDPPVEAAAQPVHPVRVDLDGGERSAQLVTAGCGAG